MLVVSKSSSDEFANVGKPNNVHMDKGLWGTTPHSLPFLLGVGPLAFDLPWAFTARQQWG